MDCCLGSTYLISTMTGLCKTERKIKLWSPSHLFQQISIGLFQQSPVCTEELTPLWIHLQGKGQGEQSVAARKGWGEGSEGPQVCSGESGCKQIAVIFPTHHKAVPAPIQPLEAAPCPSSTAQRGKGLRSQKQDRPCWWESRRWAEVSPHPRSSQSGTLVAGSLCCCCCC